MKILTKEQYLDRLGDLSSRTYEIAAEAQSDMFNSHEALRDLLRRLWEHVVEYGDDGWIREEKPELYEEVVEAVGE